MAKLIKVPLPPVMTPQQALDYIAKARTPQERQARKNMVYHILYGNPQSLNHLLKTKP